MKFIASPNFDDRPSGIDLLVMHYTGMKSAEAALSRMCDKEAKVSAHYMVYEDGEVVQLVKDEKRAWHAGISCWRGISSLNDSSIGIEIVNPGHEFGYCPFPSAQMESVAVLASELMLKHNIEPRNVVGHSDIAPSRKQDPGELFDWKFLAKKGIGLWPDCKVLLSPTKLLIEPEEESVAVAEIQKKLQRFGYHIRVDGYYGPKTQVIVTAFKRHFVPEQVNSFWDKLTDARLTKLDNLIKSE